MNFVTKKHSQLSNTETKLKPHEVARDATSTCSGSEINFRDVGAGEEERIDFIASVWSQVISSQPGDNVQLIEFPKPKSAKLGSVPNVDDSPRNDGAIGLSGRFDRGSCDLSGLNADFDGVDFEYGNTMQQINVNANPAPSQNDSAGIKINGLVNYSGESRTSVKKYGSLEHIKQLKRENTLKRDRLKSAQVRPAITAVKHAEQAMTEHNHSDSIGVEEPEADKDDALEDMCIPDDMKSLRRKISDEYNARIDPETGKDNAYETDENKTKELPSRADNEDRLYITPIKKYGSLEHMRNIKRDNAIHLKRLKSVTASSVITTPFNSFNYQNRIRSARKENASEIIPQNYVERYGAMSRGSAVGNETPRKAEHGHVAGETTEDQRSLASWTTPERKYNYESIEQTSKTTKSAQYGSKEHFENIQKENVNIRKRKNSAKSKVDTWNLENIDNVGQDRGRQTHASTTKTVLNGSLEETEKRKKK